MDHTSGEYRSMSSFHAPWSPAPTRATRAMTDGSSRMACPFQGRRDPVSPRSLVSRAAATINPERVRRRLIHRVYSKFALFKLHSVVTVGLTCTDRSPGPYGPGFDSRF